MNTLRVIFIFTVLFLCLFVHVQADMQFWNSSYDIRLKMPINNTAGAGEQIYFQINTNLSAYSASALSLRCYNRTTGSIMPHWQESISGGNVNEIWTNNSVVASGWDNNTFCSWQTIPTTSSSSSISDTFVFGDDFQGLSWEKSSNNPVVGIVNAGGQVGDPCIFYESGTFYLFVTNMTNDNITLYTGTDGVTFSRIGDVIAEGAPGSWEDNRVRDPTVVKVGSTYHMWYTGNDGNAGTGFKIGHATASSLTGTWTKDASNPVFNRSTEGVNEPSVIYESGDAGKEFKMLFTAGIGVPNDIGCGDIGYAYSSDGVSWTDFGDILTGLYQDQHQMKIGSTYFMFVNPSGGDILRSVSSDHETWSTPSFVGGALSTPGSFDSVAMYAPTIEYVDGLYYMYYQASNGSHHIIGLANSTDISGGDFWTTWYSSDKSNFVVVDNTLRLNDDVGSPKMLHSKNTVSSPIIIEARYKQSAVGDIYFSIEPTQGAWASQDFAGLVRGAPQKYNTEIGNVNGASTESVSTNWHTVKYTLPSSGDSTFQIWDLTTLKHTDTGTPTNRNNIYLSFGLVNTNYGYIDYVFGYKYNATPPVYENLELEYYIPSLYHNTTPVLNIIYSSPYEYALNQTPTGKTNTNDTAKSTGLSEIVITNYNNSASIVRNFTLTGDDLDWYQVANISGSYSMKNSSGTIQNVADGNFTTNLVAGNYWIKEAEISIVLLSQTPSIIYINSTGFLNISYGITHSVSGLNNTSVSFIYRNYDYDLSDSNHSIRPPSNNLASVWNFNGRILRAANRNETPGLNFEDNDTITGGDTYTWSGLDENSTKLTIVPVNSTYTKVYINATVHCIMPQMWYLDRTDQQQATKTQLAIHKTSNVLIKFWNFEIYKGNYDFLGVGYTDTLLSSNPALWPSDANHVNFYYVNSSYNPATGGDPITSGYAVYMGSLNASGWVDHVYSRSNSNYVRGFIDNNYLHTIVDTTNISYLYFTSNTPSSHPFYINMTNVASSTNRSFANTNTLWAGNTPPYTPQAYTPNVWFSFMKLNMSLDHKLYAADNNDLWGVSSMNRTNITQALFPPTTPVIDHFHFLGDTDYDMDGVYYGNFSIGCGVSTDPDGGDVTHNLTLHYANNLTFVTIINNTFTDKDITHNGVYFDANFSSIPYYSDDVNYTLRLIATDDESETVTVWLNKNFTLSITPIITSYTPSTPTKTIRYDTQTFTINISQIVNVTWYIDGSIVSTENNVNFSSYSNSTAPIDTYNVTAHVENVNGTRQQVWDWEVEDPIYSALLQLQADIDKMKKTQTIIQALIFLVIGVVVGVVAQRRRFNDEDSEKPIESKNN